MRYSILLAGAAVAVVTMSACGSSRHQSDKPSAAAPLTVDTTSGTVHGLATSAAREFLGIRYAQPPTGDNRWTLPVAATKAPGVTDATHAGPSCAQVGSAPGASATASVSEDCLFLNVTTPKSIPTGQKLPVMVWWHGGGYTTGSGSAYDAQRLADQGNVIVVTVNYRLGVFGYLSLPGLAGSGDFGLADQILATTWAKQNAAAFGGDPSNVTVFGESAGAMSACALLTSPAANGLVDKVAMSSGGSCQLAWPNSGLLPGVPASTPYLDLADAQKFGTAEAKTLGCVSAALSCLRAKSTKQLLGIFPVFSNVLAYNTPLLPKDPATAVLDGDAQKVPVLATGNHDEERAFVGGAQKAKSYFTAKTYPSFLKLSFADKANLVAKEYPLNKYPSAAIAWSTVITDASWACPTLAGNAALAAHGSTVFGGEFDDPNAPDVNQIGSASFAPGAAHASDIPYLFNLLGKNYLTGTAQTALSNTMIGYWSSFARTGSPTAAGAPDWPKLAGTDGPSLQLNPSKVAIVDVSAEHNCSFWKGISG